MVIFLKQVTVGHDDSVPLSDSIKFTVSSLAYST